MSAQDEIKQRLEVAQLYEEMGQLPKATRYYIAAAEIALKGKLFDKGRELLHKALQLDPDNAQAKTYLDKLDKHLASLGVAAPKAQVAPGSPAPRAAGCRGKRRSHSPHARSLSPKRADFRHSFSSLLSAQSEVFSLHSLAKDRREGDSG